MDENHTWFAFVIGFFIMIILTTAFVCGENITLAREGLQKCIVISQSDNDFIMDTAWQKECKPVSITINQQ